MRAYGRLMLLLFSVLFVYAPFALAQGSGAATVSGRVTDPTGASIPGAKIEVKQVATNLVFPTVTTDTGDYAVANLPIGKYEIHVSKAGFESVVQSGMVLQAGGDYRFDFTLKLGTVSQVVSITTEAPVLQTENAELNQVVDNAQIVELPLNGRDIQAISLVIPGVQSSREAPLGTSPAYAGWYNIAGMRENDNITTIDGAIVSDANSGMNFIATPEWVQEFELKTALYGAEFGIKPGGQWTLVVKSGTNRPHGTLFEFLRNNDLDARNFFYPGAVPPYKRNQFGAVFGAPIIIPHVFNGKNRAWFFISYSGQRLEQIVAQTGEVPTANLKQGIFPYPIINPATGMDFANNTIPSGMISAQAKDYLQFYPAPNVNCTFPCLNYSSPNSSSPTNTDNIITRLDVKQSDSTHWFGHYMWDNEPYPILEPVQTFAAVDPLHNYDALISMTHTFGPHVVNTANTSWYRRPYFPGGPSSSPQNFGSTLGIPGFPFLPNDFHGVPVLNVTGYVGLGDYSIRGPVNENFWTAQDELDYSKGKHFFKFGYEWRRQVQNWDLSGRAAFTFQSGAYTGDPFANFLLGDLTSASVSDEILGGNWAANSDYFFATDTWKVRPNLTLDLGLRYEYKGPFVDKRGLGANFDPSNATFIPPLQNLTLQPWQTGRYQAGVPMLHYSLNGEEPRIGIAYTPHPTTVIRAGWGIYGSELSVGLDEIFGENPRPNNVSETFTANLVTPNLFFSNPFNPVAAGAQGLPNVYGVQTPYPQENTQAYGLSVQQSLGSRTLLEVGYQGSQTDHMYVDTTDNDAPPGPAATVQARRPFSQYTNVTEYFGKANASWNSLEVKLEQRPGPRGLSAVLSYTYAHQIDESGARFAVPGDPGAQSRNVGLKFERGNGEADMGNKLSGLAVYQFPFGAGKPYLNSGVASKILGGWSTSGLFVAQTGPWVTAVLGGDNAGAGSTASQRPNVTGNPNQSAPHTPQKWFNTSVFSQPAQGTYGNSPRSVIQAPGLWNIDWSLMRNFKITESSRLEFRFETFNTLNHTQFQLLNSGLTYGTGTFGQISSALDARELQFGLKLYF